MNESYIIKNKMVIVNKMAFKQTRLLSKMVDDDVRQISGAFQNGGLTDRSSRTGGRAWKSLVDLFQALYCPRKIVDNVE
jgi:hypothetical protein